jgi:excisionase family DNA binding protein
MSTHHAARVTVPVHLLGTLSIRQAAALAGVSESTMRALVADGHISPHPHFATTRIGRAEFDRWASLTAREVAA